MSNSSLVSPIRFVGNQAPFKTEWNCLILSVDGQHYLLDFLIVVIVSFDREIKLQLFLASGRI